MKILTFLTLLISINLNAQVFAPDDAVWYYTYDPDVTLDDGYQKIEVIGDTVINNKTCKILQKTNIGYSYWDKDYYEINAGINIIYEEDSIVYYKKDSLFYILYNFKAKVGDSYSSISFPKNCYQQFEVKIDSIESIENNGKTLRKFYVTLNDLYQGFFIERIGYPDYLFPYFQIGCDVLTGPHYPGPLRCYSDNEIGNFSTNVVSSCEFIISSNEQKLRNKSFKVYPNPSRIQESIQIEIFDSKIKGFDIYNLLGQKLRNYNIADETSTSISIKNPGNYIICFVNKNGYVIVQERILIK
jgi:hypothetical protein